MLSDDLSSDIKLLVWIHKMFFFAGDVQPQKSKTKREADQESFKLSKKARTDSMHFAEEDHNTGGFSKKKMGSNDKLYSSSREMRCLTKNSTNLYANSHSGYRGSGYNGHGEEEEKV